MININIISGFLGAGKTTFLRKIISEMKGKTVLIENEFGEAGLDGDFIETEIPVKEIYAGCICCSLSGDLTQAIEELVSEYKPENIMIEPSGVANIIDIIKSFNRVSEKLNLKIRLNYLINIVDLSVFNDYIENFGAFYKNQIKNSKVIFLSHFDAVDSKEIEQAIKKIKEINDSLYIIKEDWYKKSGNEILELLEDIKNYEIDIESIAKEDSKNLDFSSHSIFSPRKFEKSELSDISDFLKDDSLGNILRAKGVISTENDEFIYFDYTPYNYQTKYLENSLDSKVAIIGRDLNKEKLTEYFAIRGRCKDE